MFNDAGINLIDDVVFTIVSQWNSFHVNLALEKREIWSNQLRDLARVCVWCVCVSEISPPPPPAHGKVLINLGGFILLIAYWCGNDCILSVLIVFLMV